MKINQKTIFVELQKRSDLNSSNKSGCKLLVIIHVDTIFFKKVLVESILKIIFTILNNERALSSVGSEHLPYKQGVTGSNPVGPTSINKVFSFEGLFLWGFPSNVQKT